MIQHTYTVSWKLWINWLSGTSIWINRGQHAYPRFHTFTLRLRKHAMSTNTRKFVRHSASILLLLYSITSPKPIQSESFLPFFCFRVERNSTFRIYLSIHDVRKHKEDTKKMRRGEFRFSRITLRGIFIDEYRRIPRYFWNFFISILFVCLRLQEVV